MKLRAKAYLRIAAEDWRNKYDEVWGGFRDGLTSVKLKGKWGKIDKTGKEVIPPKYATAIELGGSLDRILEIEGSL